MEREYFQYGTKTISCETVAKYMQCYRPTNKSFTPHGPPPLTTVYKYKELLQKKKLTKMWIHVQVEVTSTETINCHTVAKRLDNHSYSCHQTTPAVQSKCVPPPPLLHNTNFANIERPIATKDLHLEV